MRIESLLRNLAVATGLILLAVRPGSAAVIYGVNMDTTGLSGHPAGPLSVMFQMTDGSGTGDGNNTATITDFQFGGGSPSGSPVLAGDASGSLGSVVSLTDSSFLNMFMQTFTPGLSLAFRVTLTTNVDAGGVPDQFSFSILDSSGAALPTRGLGMIGLDSFMTVDIDSDTPQARAFAADMFRFPEAGGPAIDLAAPAVQVVPEPQTWMLLGGALVSLAVMRRRRNS